MAQPIGGIGNVPSLTWPSAVPVPDGAVPAAGESSFQALLLGAVEQTSALEQSGQAAIGSSLAGGDITQVEVFSAVKKADLALRMMLQVRNKVLDAYTEIKRMQM